MIIYFVTMRSRTVNCWSLFENSSVGSLLRIAGAELRIRGALHTEYSMKKIRNSY